MQVPNPESLRYQCDLNEPPYCATVKTLVSTTAVELVQGLTYVKQKYT